MNNTNTTKKQTNNEQYFRRRELVTVINKDHNVHLIRGGTVPT